MVVSLDYFVSPDRVEGKIVDQKARELPNDQIACALCLGHRTTQESLTKVVFVRPNHSVMQPAAAARLVEDAISSRGLPYSEYSEYFGTVVTPRNTMQRFVFAATR
jgi:hypothetical protein